jgi:non-specific serine/threonine protein kinase
LLLTPFNSTPISSLARTDPRPEDEKGLPLLVRYDQRLKDQNYPGVEDVEKAVMKGEGIDADATRNSRAREGLDMATTMERIQQSFLISDPSLPDCPIVFASDGFLDFTGYGREEILGRNCRFLQGAGTDRDAVKEIRNAIKDNRECTVRLLNYTKQGKPFWNMFTLAPVRDHAGEVRFFAGVQVDVTVYTDADGRRLDSVELLRQTKAPTPRHSGDDEGKSKSKAATKKVLEAIGGLTAADGELPWARMVGRLGAPKPHQAGDANWAALRKIVAAHKAAGRPGAFHLTLTGPHTTASAR